VVLDGKDVKSLPDAQSPQKDFELDSRFSAAQTTSATFARKSAKMRTGSPSVNLVSIDWWKILIYITRSNLGCTIDLIIHN